MTFGYTSRASRRTGNAKRASFEAVTTRSQSNSSCDFSSRAVSAMWSAATTCFFNPSLGGVAWTRLKVESIKNKTRRFAFWPLSGRNGSSPEAQAMAPRMAEAGHYLSFGALEFPP
jgi:hypothetical protein